MKFLWYFFLINCLLAVNCQNQPSTPISSFAKPQITTSAELPTLTLNYKEFDRKASLNRMTSKIKNGKPLVVHAKIPLCDNDHQGIVPVNAKLGNGFNLHTNLYWGALYGIKTHFKKNKEWTLLSSKKKINKAILERVIFYKKYPNNTEVYLIADAYQGDQMDACLNDFIRAVSGKQKSNIPINNQTIGIDGHADLIIFNGHNGLMDQDLDFYKSEDDRVRDVAVIGCVSHKYFKDHLNYAKGYPLLMTTNLMAPEAYVMEAVISSWAQLKEGPAIRVATGKAYHKYQNCGLKGATRLFKTGW